MKRDLTGAVFATILISGAFQAMAAEKPAKQNESPKSQSSAFSMQSLEGDVLDAKYRGLPIRQAVEQLEKATSSKRGEYESTQAYESRMAAALSKPILFGQPVSSRLAFVAPALKEHSASFQYHYDADSAEVVLTVNGSTTVMDNVENPNWTPTGSLSPLVQTLELGSFQLAQSTYVGSNGFGVKVRVEKDASLHVGLAPNGDSFLALPAVAYVPMTSAAAAKELPALKALVVFKLSAPYLSYAYFHAEPTRDSPYDLTAHHKFLVGSVEGVVFFSGVSGKVIARIPDGFGKPAAHAPEPETAASAQGLQEAAIAPASAPAN
jgi:hypothetical protein